ncbi:hypothetical protein [Streptomyces sp. NRRL F-2580]|uniref:hypothetical protein n=1 Tax=Streptomyces sp. NRRL F-2580 TaxID=1463841 RepID=UPI0006904CAC|nr:hypothetical protein [Streptomyces sp. NRRL F-2580]
MALFTTGGKPRDLLLHPDLKKLYVGSDDLPETAEVNEGGLHVPGPADGRPRSSVGQAPGPTGTLGRRAVHRLIAPLPGDGAVFVYPPRHRNRQGRRRRGRGRVAAGGGRPTPPPGSPPRRCWSRRAPYARRSHSQRDREAFGDAGGRRGVRGRRGARGAVWFTDIGNRRMYRVDTATFQVG